jgi:hypothetical protein
MDFGGKSFWHIRSKTEYMKCDFNTTTQDEGDVKLDGQVVSIGVVTSQEK